MKEEKKKRKKVGEWENRQDTASTRKRKRKKGPTNWSDRQR